MWLEQAIEGGIIPSGADQYNSLHDKLIDAWKAIGQSASDVAGRVHLAGMTGNPEDAGTLAYLEDTAHQAGLSTTVLAIDAIGRQPNGTFVDLEDRPIELAFKLYPWEWMFQDAFGEKIAAAPTRWIEPPWKAILSNKGVLPLLWEMFPKHPNLLPAFFEDDPKASMLGSSFVRKPLFSREGANVTLVSAGTTLMEQQGPYGAEGYIRQALAPLANNSDQYAVIGSWLIDHTPCGLSIREDENPITGNTSRFLPHAIV
jgi:glutathionylspermidine synthase